MSATTTHAHAKALAVAEQMKIILSAVCDKIIIAGSIRRGKSRVGDIELLYIPKLAVKPDPADLFGKPMQINLADAVIESLLADGILTKRLKEDGTQTWGPLIKLSTHTDSGIPVDFFSATPENWWTLLVCRTGSADSNMAICNAAIRLGMQWSPYEGFKDRKDEKLIFVPHSERAVFERVGLPYRKPQDRL